MKIFTVNYFAPHELIGGSEIQCWLIAKHLAKRGHRTAYVALRGLGGKKEEERGGVKVFYLTGQNESKLKIFVNFYRLLKREKPDLCYLRYFRFLFFLSWIAKFLKIPVVFNTSHINDCRPNLEKIKFSLNPFGFLMSVKIVVQRHLNFSALRKISVVTINKGHSQLLWEKHKIKATAIYNSMEDNYGQNRREKKKQVVWVNNIKGRKRPELFAALAGCFKSSGWQFLMIGDLQVADNPYEERIRKWEKDNSAFQYLGRKTPGEVDRILAGAMIFVNTCQPEGFGNNFIQAWLNECPTITLTFDPDDIIKNEQIGFHSITEEQMREDLKKLMDDNSLRMEMGERARKYALKNHSISENVKKYEAKFRQIIDETNRKKI